MDQGLSGTRKLAINRLSKSFGGLEALRGITVAIERGEFIAVVGPSGCGKTTFLRIVAGLEAASSGEVLLDGRAVRKPGTDRGFVFQSDNLLPWRSVFGNAMIGPELAGDTGPEQRRRIWNYSSWSVWKDSKAITRASSPAECGNASTWRARWPSIRRFC